MAQICRVKVDWPRGPAGNNGKASARSSGVRGGAPRRRAPLRLKGLGANHCCMQAGGARHSSARWRGAGSTRARGARAPQQQSHVAAPPRTSTVEQNTLLAGGARLSWANQARWRGAGSPRARGARARAPSSATWLYRMCRSLGFRIWEWLLHGGGGGASKVWCDSAVAEHHL